MSIAAVARLAKMPAFLLAILALAGPAGAAPGPTAPSAVLASIRLHNPTAWARPVPIEVPVGKLAAPGRIDWSRVRLVTGDGKDVPFALREGRPHWKARLTAPVTAPRAEDLLVFSCPVPPGRWARLDLVDGPFPLDQPGAIDAWAEALENWGEALAMLRAHLDFSVDLRPRG